MWTCAKCGGRYFQKNLWHGCSRYSVRQFLLGKPERAVKLYRYFLREYRSIGPITLHATKSRIAFMVKVRFSGVHTMSKDYIAGAFWLKQKISSKKFYKTEFIPRDNFIHRFRIYDEADVDDEFRKYMRMAYEIGERRHISRRKPGVRSPRRP